MTCSKREEVSMEKYFRTDGALLKFLSKLTDFLILDMLVLIFCIPVITIGPALTAAYYVSLKEVRNEEDSVIKSFWKSFRQNFLQSFLVEVLLAAVGGFLYLDITTAYHNADDSMFYRILFYVVIGAIAIVFATFIYIFPIISRFENTLFNQIKNSLLMAVSRIIQTVVMVVLSAGFLYFSIMYPTLIPFTVIMMIYVNSYIIERIFRIYIPEDEKEKNPDDFHMDMDYNINAPAQATIDEDVADSITTESKIESKTENKIEN